MEEDLLPEYCHYRDEGCEFAPSCLNCSFPYCLEDVPRGKQYQRKESRDLAILEVFRADGTTLGGLARKFGVSKRTVQRVLRRARSSIQQ